MVIRKTRSVTEISFFMAIRNLLNKINRQQAVLVGKQELTPVVREVEPASKFLLEKDNRSLRELSFEELEEKYKEVASWLETHEAQSGTNNRLDVNYRPYDPELYEKKHNELFSIMAEIYRKPLVENL